MKNQNGYAIVGVILMLAILTVIGLSAMRTSITETQISTNSTIHTQTFYAAESGIFHGAMWAAKNDTWEDTPSDGNGKFQNGASYDFNVEYQKDAAGNIMNHTDPVTNLVLPRLKIVGTGSHIREAKAVIESIWIMRPIFLMPETPIWVFDSINAQGNVEVRADTGSGNRDEVWFTLAPTLPYSLPNKMHCPDGDGCSYSKSPEAFPTDEVRERIKKSADYSGNVFPTDLVSKSSSDHPVVVYMNGDVHVNDATIAKNVNTGVAEGWGILFVDGSAIINGNIKWHGLIIIRDSTQVGNGTAEIDGALIAGHNTTPGQPSDGIIDVSLSGAIDINYDRNALKNLQDKTKKPAMLAWKEM